MNRTLPATRKPLAETLESKRRELRELVIAKQTEEWPSDHDFSRRKEQLLRDIETLRQSIEPAGHRKAA